MEGQARINHEIEVREASTKAATYILSLAAAVVCGLGLLGLLRLKLPLSQLFLWPLLGLAVIAAALALAIRGVHTQLSKAGLIMSWALLVAAVVMNAGLLLVLAGGM